MGADPLFSILIWIDHLFTQTYRWLFKIVTGTDCQVGDEYIPIARHTAVKEHPPGHTLFTVPHRLGAPRLAEYQVVANAHQASVRQWLEHLMVGYTIGIGIDPALQAGHAAVGTGKLAALNGWGNAIVGHRRKLAHSEKLGLTQLPWIER